MIFLMIEIGESFKHPLSYKELLMFVHVVPIILAIILISVLPTIYPRITNERVKAENSPDSSP